MSRRILSGEVVSTKMDKTVVVLVKRMFRHPLYHKNITQSKKYAAHDEKNSYAQGDQVIIRETRPLSKTKKWEVLSLASGESR